MKKFAMLDSARRWPGTGSPQAGSRSGQRRRGPGGSGAPSGCGLPGGRGGMGDWERGGQAAMDWADRGMQSPTCTKLTCKLAGITLLSTTCGNFTKIDNVFYAFLVCFISSWIGGEKFLKGILLFFSLFSGV